MVPANRCFRPGGSRCLNPADFADETTASDDLVASGTEIASLLALIRVVFQLAEDLYSLYYLQCKRRKPCET